MITPICVILVVSFSLIGSAFGQGEPQIIRRTSVVSGEVLIKFRPQVQVQDNAASRASVSTAMRTASSLESQVVKFFPRYNAALVKIALPTVQDGAPNAAEIERTNRSTMRSTMTALADLNAPLIEYVQPNYVYYPSDTPNDSLLSEQRFVDLIKLKDGWSVRHDANDIVVAVVDTGVMLTHPDLRENLWTNTKETPGNGIDDDNNGYKDDVNGWNFHVDQALPAAMNPDAELVSNGLPFFGFCLQLPGMTFEKHGTHVAGIIGAVGNNGQGTAGVAWKVKIMPLKFLGGACGFGDTARAIQAIDYAVANGAKIVNCSWGGSPSDGGVDRLLEESIIAASERDVLVVCAAGNSNLNNELNAHYPSNFSSTNLLAVGACTDADQKADFSNFGDRSVHLFAHGVDIHSTLPQGTSQPASAAYGNLSGTSMATPIVSGLAALVRAQFPSLTAKETRLWLMKTVDGVEALKGTCVTAGRANAQRALSAPMLPTSPPQPLQHLSAEQWAAIQTQLAPDDRVRMALFGGLSINPPSPPPVTGAAPQASPIEVLIAFTDKMDEAGIRRSCASSIVEISKVETISQARNVYRIVGKTSFKPDELETAIRKSVPNIRMIQPNFKYRAEAPK